MGTIQPRFYLMNPPEANECVADANEERVYKMEKIRCPIEPGHARGRRISPLDVDIPCDPPPGIIFTWMSECLIQESVELVFESEGLTGFSALPAKARLKGTGADVRVYELAVTGWGGMAPAASGIQEAARCSGCGHLHYSGLEKPEKLVNPVNWDGSDFFMIWPLPRFRFVTERVVQACERHGVTGVAFYRNWPTDSTAGRGYSPGRLSYYMPQDRAHLLGDTLGIA
jgi:hypothetical protein